MPESNLTALRSGKPGSRHLLERAMGLGPLREFLDILSIDVAELFDDFTGVGVDASLWNTVTAGTAPAAFGIPSSPERGGIVTGSTGTTAGNTITLSSSAVFQGNVLFEVRLRPNLSFTSAVFEFGLEAGTHTVTTRAVTDIDIPTFSAGVTDVALFHKDVAQTISRLAAVVKGSAAGQTSFRSDLGAANDLVLGAFRTYAIRVNAPDVVEFFINGERVAVFDRRNDPDGVVNSTVLFRPIIRIIGNSTASVGASIDYVRVIGDRV